MTATDSTATNGVDDKERGLHQTPTTVTIPSELFEKLYLTPKVPHVGDCNRRFANPTALGFVGQVSLFLYFAARNGLTDNRSLVISTFTFSIVCMGWGGAKGLSPVV